jgi:hypothetical protein
MGCHPVGAPKANSFKRLPPFRAATAQDVKDSDRPNPERYQRYEAFINLTAAATDVQKCRNFAFAVGH